MFPRRSTSKPNGPPALDGVVFRTGHAAPIDDKQYRSCSSRHSAATTTTTAATAHQTERDRSIAPPKTTPYAQLESYERITPELDAGRTRAAYPGQ
jgi:hypothetical protein